VAEDRHFQYASPIAEFPLRVNRNVKLIVNHYKIIPIIDKSNRYPPEVKMGPTPSACQRETNKPAQVASLKI